MEISFYTSSGTAKGKVQLPAALINAEASRRTLHEVIVTLQGNQRQGTSSTKTRGNVSGGGRKPWKQKGTGNARSGSIRSPLWRKGGIIFGPLPRSYRIDLDAQRKRQAIQAALAEKAKVSEIAVLESFPESEGKTAVAEKLLAKIHPAGRVLLVVDKKTDLLNRALRNISRLTLVDAREVNAWTLFGAKQILITQPALDALSARFPKG